MGAGVLPVALYKKKLYFLLGKENEYNDQGWSDFGGGRENNESDFETAIREGYEELNGFLGTKKAMKKMLESKLITTVNEQYYTSYLVKVEYDDKLPFYFNNHFKFIKNNLNHLIKDNNGMFEKQKIKWFTIDELKNEKNYRSYYIKLIIAILKKTDMILHIMNNI